MPYHTYQIFLKSYNEYKKKELENKSKELEDNSKKINTLSISGNKKKIEKIQLYEIMEKYIMFDI